MDAADDTADRITALRAELEALMAEAGPVLRKAKEAIEPESERLAELIRARPLTAMAVALGVGFLLARITR